MCLVTRRTIPCQEENAKVEGNTKDWLNYVCFEWVTGLVFFACLKLGSKDQTARNLANIHAVKFAMSDLTHSEVAYLRS